MSVYLLVFTPSNLVPFPKNTPDYVTMQLPEQLHEAYDGLCSSQIPPNVLRRFTWKCVMIQKLDLGSKFMQQIKHSSLF